MRLPEPMSPPQRVLALAAPVVVEATFLSRRDFLSQVTVSSEACTFVISNASELRPGAEVRVKLRFAGLAVAFDLAGVVQRCQSWGEAVIEARGADVLGFALAYAFARGLPTECGRRGSERIAVSLPCELGRPGREPVRSVVQDLSRGGARVALAAASLNDGDPVQFVIRLGLLRRLRGSGSVAWAARRGEGLLAGIEFGDLEAAARLSLSRFLLGRRATR